MEISKEEMNDGSPIAVNKDELKAKLDRIFGDEGGDHNEISWAEAVYLAEKDAETFNKLTERGCTEAGLYSIWNDFTTQNAESAESVAKNLFELFECGLARAGRYLACHVKSFQNLTEEYGTPRELMFKAAYARDDIARGFIYQCAVKGENDALAFVKQLAASSRDDDSRKRNPFWTISNPRNKRENK